MLHITVFIFEIKMAANINTVVFWLMTCHLKWFELPWR